MSFCRLLFALAVVLSSTLAFSQDVTTLQARNKVLQDTLAEQQKQIQELKRENRELKMQMEVLRLKMEKMQTPNATTSSNAGGWSEPAKKPATPSSATKEGEIRYKNVPVDDRWIRSVFFRCNKMIFIDSDGKYYTLKDQEPISDKPAKEGVLYYFPKPRSKTGARYPFKSVTTRYYQMDPQKELIIQRLSYSYNSGIRTSSSGAKEVVRVNEPEIEIHLRTNDAPKYLGKAMPYDTAMVYRGLYTRRSLSGLSAIALPSFSIVEQITLEQFKDFLKKGNELPITPKMPNEK